MQRWMLRVGILCCPVGVQRANHVLMHALGTYCIYQRRGCQVLFCFISKVSYDLKGERAEARCPAFLYVESIKSKLRPSWVFCGQQMVDGRSALCFLILSSLLSFCQ